MNQIPPELQQLLGNPLALILGNLTAATAAVAVLIGGAVLAAVFGLYKERAYRQMRRRLDELAKEQPVSEWDSEEPEIGFRERVLTPLSSSMLTKLGSMSPSGNMEAIRSKLIQSGNPANLAVIDFLGLKMFAAIACAGLACFYFLSGPTPTLVKTLLWSGGAGLIGLFLPNLWLAQLVSKRKNEIGKALPDALDMLTTMVDAGLGFDMALVRLCEKWDNPLTEEFGRMVTEMRMGVRKADALRNMVARVDVPEVSTFAAVLIQADALGISIGRILHTQSDQIRTRRRQWIEEKAAQMPLKMLPVIVLFIFPALFAVILGPAIPMMVEGFGGL